MSCVAEVLQGVAPELETEVKKRLRGFFGAMLRHYLPQTWVFRTEDGTASLRVDGQGAVTVAPGALVPADVTIEVGHDRLRQMLTTRSRDPNATGPLNVTTHTAKGKAAFGYLRERLGMGPN
jgi:hypothetical protein